MNAIHAFNNSIALADTKASGRDVKRSPSIPERDHDGHRGSYSDTDASPSRYSDSNLLGYFKRKLSKSKKSKRPSIDSALSFHLDTLFCEEKSPEHELIRRKSSSDKVTGDGLRSRSSKHSQSSRSFDGVFDRFKHKKNSAGTLKLPHAHTDKCLDRYSTPSPTPRRGRSVSVGIVDLDNLADFHRNIAGIERIKPCNNGDRISPENNDNCRRSSSNGSSGSSKSFLYSSDGFDVTPELDEDDVGEEDVIFPINEEQKNPSNASLKSMSGRLERTFS
ncbi:unnamed protein product, partial [Owenia fusiformis]